MERRQSPWDKLDCVGHYKKPGEFPVTILSEMGISERFKGMTIFKNSFIFN